MNKIIIVLGVAILILIYILYTYFTAQSTQLSETHSLKASVQTISKVERPFNTRYAHSIWLYVNTWDNNVEKTVIDRTDNMKLYLDAKSPTLKYDLTMSNGETNTMVITDNFPLQKWVCIIISVDNQFVDAYIDGKLVKSQRFYIVDGGYMPKQPPSGETPLLLGNTRGGFDAQIADFRRWTQPVDPATAWDLYLKGNGQQSTLSKLSTYGVDVSILKNNEEATKFSLF